MKNLKKVLALVLAFACAFTMFAGALTFSDVKPGDDYSAAITMLSDLEVISGDGKGNYNPTGTITRAEACVLIANIMNGGKADTARFAGGSNFSDVAKTFWGESAIAYCVQNGVTAGVGGGKFAPSRAITDAEFVAMVTRAMGYDTPANPLSFPYGNYTAAVNNGLVDNVPYVEGSPCTKGEAAQILYDALFADYARYTANQNVIHNTTTDHDNEEYTLIKVVFGLHMAQDNEKACKQHKWVITALDCTEEDAFWAQPVDDKDNEMTDDKEVKFETTADVSSLLGYEVILWGEPSHAREPEKDYYVDNVKAVEVIEGQKVYEYNATMADSDEDDDKIADFDKLKVGEDYEKAMNDNDGYSYTLFDWDGDDDCDFSIRTIRDYYVVKSITSKVVKLTGIGVDDIELELDGKTEGFDCTVYNAEHDVACEIPEDIENGDIVEIVKADCLYKKTATWTMSIVEPETKEITEIEAKKGKKSIYFDDEKLELANRTLVDNDTFEKFDDEDEETNWDVWQNANGYILKMVEADEAYSGYLFVRGQGNGSTATNNRKLATIDVTFEDGTSEDDVELVKDADVTMNGVTVYDDDDRTFTGVKAADENTKYALVGHAFKYQKNDDGQITKLVQVAKSEKSYYTYDESQEKIGMSDVSVAEAKKYNDARWLDKCEVIFAVDVCDENVCDATNNVYNYAHDERIGAGDVKVYSYKDVTSDFDSVHGVEYDTKTNTTTKFDKVAVMGVDNFRMFNDYTENLGLIYSVTYSTKNDNYTVKGYFAGSGEEVSYKTIDEDDLAASVVTALNNAVITTGANNMVYAVVEFNTDGEITNFGALAAVAATEKWMDLERGDYKVGRVALNHLTSINSDLVVSRLVCTGENSAKPQVSTNTTKDYKFADDAVFFVTADKDDDNNKVAMPVVANALAIGEKMSAADGFLTTDLKAYTSGKFISFFDDTAIGDNEYMVADVVLNKDGDVAMIVAFDELVEAGHALTLTPEAGTLTYGTNATLEYKAEKNGVDIKSDRIKTITFASPVQGLKAETINAGGADDATDVKVTITTATPAGEYVADVVLRDGTVGTLTVKVNVAANTATLDDYNQGAEVWVSNVPAGSTVTGHIERKITDANNDEQIITVATLNDEAVADNDGKIKLGVEWIDGFSAQAGDEVKVVVTNPNYKTANLKTVAQ